MLLSLRILNEPAKTECGFPQYTWVQYSNADGKLIYTLCIRPIVDWRGERNLIEELNGAQVLELGRLVDLSFFLREGWSISGRNNGHGDGSISKAIYAGYSERTHPLPWINVGKVIGGLLR